MIRYCRDGDPILSSSKNLPEVDKCECGSERRFEFQVSLILPSTNSSVFTSVF